MVVEYIEPSDPRRDVIEETVAYSGVTSTWYVYHPQQLNDVIRCAQNAADIANRPQLINVRYEGGPASYILQPNPVKHALLRGK